LRTPVKFLVVAIFLAWLGASIYGATRISRGLEEDQAIPKDSYLVPFFNMESLYFGDLGPPVYIVFLSNVNYTDPATVSTFASLYNSVLLDDYIAGPMISWYYVFRLYTQITFDTSQIAPDQFIPFLSQFEVDQQYGGTYFQGDIIQDPTNKSVIATRWMTYFVGLNVTDDFVAGMVQVRDTVDSFQLDCFTYSVFYVFFEEYITIARATIQNVGLALFGMFVVLCWFLNMSIGAALIDIILIAMVIVDTAGIMALWSVTLNPLSSVNLVMGVGLSVEFMGHITRSFTFSNFPTKNARVSDAMQFIGHSVVGGGLSTLMAVSVLGFATYPILNLYYFRMYFTIIITAMLHGFILLPVVLSLIGPSYNSCFL